MKATIKIKVTEIPTTSRKYVPDSERYIRDYVRKTERNTLTAYERMTFAREIKYGYIHGVSV